MTVTDELLANNAEYAAAFSGPLPLPPAKHLAVVACMDARLDVYRILGLNEGEAHVIRNAGGVVTDDEIRSLAISQRLLGTDARSSSSTTPTAACSRSPTTSSRPRSRTRPASSRPGPRKRSPTWTRTSGSRSRRIKASPFIPHKDSVRGFVFDVATGKLERGQVGDFGGASLLAGRPRVSGGPAERRCSLSWNDDGFHCAP